MSTLAIIILLASVTTIIVVIAVVYMKPKHVVKKLYPQMGDTGGMMYGNTGGMYGDTGGMYGNTGGMYGNTGTMMYGNTGGMMYGDTGGMMYGDTGGMMYGDTGGMMYGDTGGMMYGEKVNKPMLKTLTNINTEFMTNTDPFYIQSSTTELFVKFNNAVPNPVPIMVSNISDATEFRNDKALITSPIGFYYNFPTNIDVATNYSSNWPGGDRLLVLKFSDILYGSQNIVMNTPENSTIRSSQGKGGNAFTSPYLVNLLAYK